MARGTSIDHEHHAAERVAAEEALGAMPDIAAALGTESAGAGSGGRARSAFPADPPDWVDSDSAYPRRSSEEVLP
jgi:hypothetical protein